MTPFRIVSPTALDAKIQHEFSALLGSQSMATQLPSSIQADWHSARVEKLWEIPSKPWTSILVLQQSGSDSINKYKRQFIRVLLQADKLHDACNSLYHNQQKSQITWLQQIQNSLARAVVKTPKSSYATPVLRSLHWLKITERTEYKLLSLTYKVFTTTQPSYLHNLITVQPPRITCSSSLVTLARPSTSSCLRITDRSFQHASSRLWNQLLASLRQVPVNHALISPILPHPVLWVALPPSVPFTHHFHHPSHLHSFTPRLKPSSSANPFHCSLPFFRTDCTDFPECLPILLSISVFTF